MIKQFRLLCAALALSASVPALAADPNTLVYYNLAGNQTLDPADPQNNSSYAHDSLLAIFDPLIRLDDAGNPGPGLAESWTRSAGLDEITLTLRQGATFHDGTPVTAATVAQSLERNTALDKRAGSSIREAMGLIASIEVLDERTIRLKLKTPSGQIESWLGGTAGMILAPAAYADGAAGGTIKPIGAGPYRVRSFDSNTKTALTRNDTYWGGTTDRPLAFELHYVPDGRARLNALRSGQATVVLLDPRQINEAKTAGMTVQVNEKNAFWTMYFNSSRAGLADGRIRRAVMHAIDREALSSALGYGSTRATEQIFAGASPLNIKALDNRYPYDPAKARALLAEAGLKDGLELSVLLLNNTEFRQLAEALQAMVAESGIRFKYDTVDVSQFPLFFQKPSRGDMMLGRYGGRSEPVQMLFELVGTGGPFSPGGAVTPEIDALLSKAKVMDSRDPARLAVLRDVVTLVSNNAAIVPIMTRSNVYAFKPGCVVNLPAYLPGGADRFNDTRIGASCK